MDRNHRINAPHNESLETIEQLGDHSELSALYFDARDEWEDKEIISDEERHSRLDKELLAATLSIRKWFVVIGVLVPLPLVLLSILLAFGLAVINTGTAKFALLLVIFLLGTWLAISFLAIRKVLTIFYAHAIRAAPFIIALTILDGLATQASLLLTRSFLPGTLFGNSVIVGGITLIVSIIISGPLLTIWTSPKLDGNKKMGLIGLIACALLVVIFGATLAL